MCGNHTLHEQSKKIYFTSKFVIAVIGFISLAKYTPALQRSQVLAESNCEQNKYCDHELIEPKLNWINTFVSKFGYLVFCVFRD